MKTFTTRTLSAATLVVAATALGACSAGSGTTIASAPAPVMVEPAPAPEPVKLVFAAPDDATVWRLRSGLNVAALTCTGGQRVSVAPQYRELLKRHERMLSAAYQSEVGRHGVRNFDRHQTKIYNRFSQQRSPVEFCATAAQVASEAVRLDSTNLWPAAPMLVAKLENGLG